MQQSQCNAVKSRCFIIENVRDKSGEVVCIKLQFINFTLNLKCPEKIMYIALKPT